MAGRASSPSLFPSLQGRRRTELLSARPSSSRHGQQGVCPLHKPPLSLSYAGSGLEAGCFEGQDHTESLAIGGTANYPCLPGCLATAWQEPPLHTEQGGLKHTAQASAGHGRGKRPVL